MTDLDQTCATLADLIGFETVSTDSNLEMIAYLAERLSNLGAAVEILRDETGQKATLFGRLGPERTGGLMLSGHTDVVPVTDQNWTTDPFTMDVRDDRIYGRGACDMKGFIAACLTHAERVSADNLHHPLHFAFTYDEETGCLGAQHLVEALRGRDILPSIAMIGEPTDMRVIEGHKGCYEYTTSFHGLEGHGSAPDQGVNAVEFATRYVTRLLQLRDALKSRAPVPGRFDPPWTTINLGRLSGGVAHNVIANHATLDWEMRPVQAGDAEFVKDDLAGFVAETLLPQMRAIYPDAAIDTEVIAEVVGLEPADENRARDILLDLTGGNRAETVAFGTEAGLFQSLGIQAVVCGPGSIEQAHKADEFVSRAQLALCLDVLDRLTPRATAA